MKYPCELRVATKPYIGTTASESVGTGIISRREVGGSPSERLPQTHSRVTSGTSSSIESSRLTLCKLDHTVMAISSDMLHQLPKMNHRSKIMASKNESKRPSGAFSLCRSTI